VAVAMLCTAPASSLLHDGRRLWCAMTVVCDDCGVRCLRRCCWHARTLHALATMGRAHCAGVCAAPPRPGRQGGSL